MDGRQTLYMQIRYQNTRLFTVPLSAYMYLFFLQVLLIDPDTPDEQVRKAYRKVTEDCTIHVLGVGGCETVSVGVGVVS